MGLICIVIFSGIIAYIKCLRDEIKMLHNELLDTGLDTNRKLRNCVEHYAENGYSKAIKCLKELE